MSLRWRLSLFYTLLVGVVLSLTALALHLALHQTLRTALDQSLQETVQLVRPTLLRERENEGEDHLHLNEAQLGALPPEVSVILLDSALQVLYASGRVPPGLQAQLGFSQAGKWRVYGERLGSVYLLAARSLESLEDSLNRFDRLLALAFPLALLAALGMGYWLVGRALAPADHLTQAAYALAQSGKWRERLPEPKSKDELWRVSRSVNTLLQGLSQVIEREQRFTQDVAHELRTPLTVLRGRLERAIETGDASQVRQALSASDELLGIVEKLLGLARAEQGQGLELKPLVLDELALEVSEAFRPLFAQKSLELQLDLPLQPVRVMADAWALRLVVRNLLENALKFTAQGGATLEVKAEGNHARLSVEDSGPGIPSTALSHLFEPFYQAEVSYRRQGSGLGLALVERIVKQHGGQVFAENRNQGGARIGFTLPLGPAKGE